MRLRGVPIPTLLALATAFATQHATTTDDGT
jgi:hypothetical protein